MFVATVCSRSSLKIGLINYAQLYTKNMGEMIKQQTKKQNAYYF